MTKLSGEEDSLDRKIEEAWADGGVDLMPVDAGEVRKRLVIQRIFFGASWLLMLPIFIWLMWPWIEESMSSAPEPLGVEIRAVEGQLEEVRGRLEEFRRKREVAPNGKGKTDDERQLKSEEGRLRQRLARYSAARDDVEIRIAIGAIGLATWSVMIALAIRSRLARPGGA